MWGFDSSLPSQSSPAPSSRGPGRSPLKAQTGVRIPVALPDHSKTPGLKSRAFWFLVLDVGIVDRVVGVEGVARLQAAVVAQVEGAAALAGRAVVAVHTLAGADGL